MKIKYIFILIAFISMALKAQENEVLDTIYANEQKNVALFFPEPIRQGITGAKNFVFSYNREKEQYFGLLQATPGKESNLLVINGNGAIFSYIVRYSKKLPKLNYFVPGTESIGNERPSTSIEMVNNDSIYQIKYKYEYYQRFCSFLINQKQQIYKLKKLRKT